MTSERVLDEKKSIRPKPENVERTKQASPGNDAAKLQQLVGNRTVQRILAQRSGGEGSFELDDETATRINQERDSGQPLDSATQEKTGAAMGYDFSDVRVHTSPESDNLNRELGAKAFTSGQDLFFRQGAYEPNSSGGQELIAHELTHVVQQGTGAVSSGGSGMTVNAPGDTFEHEADAVAQNLTPAPASTQVNRQEEDEEVQMQPLEEEEEAAQMQEMEEDEEVQTQPLEEEEEELQTQVDEDEGEEEVMP